MPQFFWRNKNVLDQLSSADGFRRGKLLWERKLTFWTITAWESEAAMRAFRNGGAHLSVMSKLLDWCDEASVAHWQQAEMILPDWTIARERMRNEGRISKVRYPSSNHADLKLIPMPRKVNERLLRPAQK